MDWQSIVQTLGTVTVGSGFLFYLLRGVFNQMLSRDLEKFKTELKIAAFEHETRYARLHEDRARAIDELYGLLVDAHEGLSAFVAPVQVGGDQERLDKAKETVTKLNTFFTFFHRKDIYLDPPLCAVILTLEIKFRQIIAKFYTPAPPAENWIAAWEKLENDVPPIKAEIANRFRQILGVRNEQGESARTNSRTTKGS